MPYFPSSRSHSVLLLLPFGHRGDEITCDQVKLCFPLICDHLGQGNPGGATER